MQGPSAQKIMDCRPFVGERAAWRANGGANVQAQVNRYGARSLRFGQSIVPESHGAPRGVSRQSTGSNDSPNAIALRKVHAEWVLSEVRHASVRGALRVVRVFSGRLRGASQVT